MEIYSLLDLPDIPDLSDSDRSSSGNESDDDLSGSYSMIMSDNVTDIEVIERHMNHENVSTESVSTDESIVSQSMTSDRTSNTVRFIDCDTSLNSSDRYIIITSKISVNVHLVKIKNGNIVTVKNQSNGQVYHIVRSNDTSINSMNLYQLKPNKCVNLLQTEKGWITV